MRERSCIRRSSCIAASFDKLGFLGLKLDRTANEQTFLDRDIATEDSRARILVIRAEEDWAIAGGMLEARTREREQPESRNIGSSTSCAPLRSPSLAKFSARDEDAVHETH